VSVLSKFRDVFFRAVGRQPEQAQEAKPPQRDDEWIRVYPFQASAKPEEISLTKDGTLSAVLRFLTEVVLGAGWHFDGEDADAVAEVLPEVTDKPGFSEMLRACMLAMFSRFAVVEVIWQQRGEWWLPERYRLVPHDAVSMHISERGEVERVEVFTTAGIQELPLARAIIHRYKPSLAHPEGETLLDSIREDVHYKRRGDDALVKNVERFAAPFIVGRYPPGMSAEQKRELLDQLKKLQSASVAVLPEGVGVEVIEGRGVSSRFAMDAVSFFERRIARQVLGSVLAMFEAEFGTRAQAATHWQIIRYVAASYQSDIEATINEQLVQRVLRWNGLPDQVAFKLNEPDVLDRTNIARWVADLATAGVLDLEEDRQLIRRMFGFVEG